MKTLYARQAAKYLARSCPKCAGYFGVIVSRLPYHSSIRAVSGWCKRCNYQIAWALVVKEKGHPRTKHVRSNRPYRDTRSPVISKDKEPAKVDQFFVGTKKI